MDITKNIYYIKANEGENPSKLKQEKQQEETRQDLNDITEFSDMKLHVKQLQEDLWDFISSVRKFKSDLAATDKKLAAKDKAIKRNNRNNKILFGLFGTLLFLIIKKK